MKVKKEKYIKIEIKIYISFIIIFLTTWFNLRFGVLDLEQMIFTFLSNNTLAGSDFIKELLMDLVIVIVPLLIVSILINKISKIKNVPYITIKVLKKEINIFFMGKKFLNILSTIILIFSLFYMFNYLGITTYIKHISLTSNIYEEYYVDPNNVEIIFPKEKRNLIYIILESMEADYSNYIDEEKSLKNLIPNLQNIALNNTYFSNSNSYGGIATAPLTTWTVASLVAQTSGVPLNIPINGNSYGNKASFLPYIITIGDILEKEGYNQMFMVGSDADYGGRKTYFKTHGNYEIWDYLTAKEKKRIPDNYFVWWGFEDSKLFKYAKEEITRLSLKDEPFNFTMLTVNTHFFDGYTEEECERKYESSYANAITCSDFMISEFINWIQNQDFYNNTSIILIGDHPTMNDVFYPDNIKERTIYNAFINVPVSNDNNLNRQANILDMFPTTLASIGVNIEGNRLGLGTNLFSNEKTLTEELGKAYFEEELYKRSKYYTNNFIYNNETFLNKITKLNNNKIK